MVIVIFPEGVTIDYDYTCTNVAGFSGDLECSKITELQILVENGFNGFTATSATTLSIRFEGIYGYTEKTTTESIVIQASCFIL